MVELSVELEACIELRRSWRCLGSEAESVDLLSGDKLQQLQDSGTCDRVIFSLWDPPPSSSHPASATVSCAHQTWATHPPLPNLQSPLAIHPAPLPASRFPLPHSITYIFLGALYVPTPRNALESVLPEFADGKSPTQGCTCTNGNPGGDYVSGCDQGLRGPSAQSCLW